MEKLKNVLIVGGSSSLGLSLVSSFLKRNCQVCYTYNKNKNVFDKNVTSINLDLKSEKSISIFVDSLKNKEKFDIVIFLPALLFGKKLDDYLFNEIHECMSVNFNSQAYILSKIIKKLSNQCCILFVSSISGEKGSYDPIYAASKGAQIAFVKSLSNWLSPKLRINVISPSLIEDSKMYYEMDEKRRNFHKSSNPMNKLLTKEELSEIICDITSEHWSHFNGQILPVNGGQYS